MFDLKWPPDNTESIFDWNEKVLTSSTSTDRQVLRSESRDVLDGCPVLRLDDQGLPHDEYLSFMGSIGQHNSRVVWHNKICVIREKIVAYKTKIEKMKNKL